MNDGRATCFKQGNEKKEEKKKKKKSKRRKNHCETISPYSFVFYFLRTFSNTIRSNIHVKSFITTENILKLPYGISSKATK